MEIGGYKFPDDLYYDLEHNWARIDGNRVTVGISDFAQAIAGEIVYAEVPRVGRKIELSKPFMSMESGKWVGRIKAIVSGQIVEANEEIEMDSTVINKSPYDQGWLAAVEMSNAAEVGTLLRPSDPKFQAFIEEQKKKYSK